MMNLLFQRIHDYHRLVWLTIIPFLCCWMNGYAQSNTTEVQLNQQLKTCTAKTGYDPKNPGMVNERELAPTEESYLLCAYARIRSEIIPKSSVPDDYRHLIEQYKQMTRDIAHGNSTRSERADRARQMLDTIAAKEQAHASASASSQQAGQASAPGAKHAGESELSKFSNESVRQILALPPPTVR